jgi:hypothetical protein
MVEVYQIYIAFVALKLLVYKGYKSTDYDVH